MAKQIMTPEEWRALVKRTREVFEHPGLIEIICSHVADGGSVLDFAKDYGVKHSDIIRWIRMDKERSESYERALRDRKEHVIESVLSVLNNISMFDIRELYDEAGNLKDIKNWPEHVSKVISSVKPTEWGLEVKTTDRLKAIEMIGKNLGLFVEDKLQDGAQTLVDLIVKSYERGSRELSERQSRDVAETNSEPIGVSAARNPDADGAGET